MRAASLAMPLILALLAIAAGVWFWSDTLRAREQVLFACAQACAREQLQFLDQTVALARMRAARNAQGRLVLQREYRFEFSRDGADRYAGRVVLLGHTVIALHLHGDH